jgi:DNA-binding Lrp family transcriptional regulator
MLQVVAADLESFGTLVLKKLLKVPGVRDVQSSLVLDTLKRSARIPLSHLLPQSKLAPPGDAPLFRSSKKGSVPS